MAWGRRCGTGCESWPDLYAYAKCPICGQEATRYSNLEPLTKEEAESLVRHWEFEAFYEQHCNRLRIPVDGPLPDDLPAHGTAVVATDSALVSGRGS